LIFQWFGTFVFFEKSNLVTPIFLKSHRDSILFRRVLK
jgi:hypothetical protein